MNLLIKRLTSVIVMQTRLQSSVSKPPYKTLFFGSDNFALTHLEILNQNRACNDRTVQDLEVVIASEKCPVARYAVEKNLKIQKWPIKTDSTSYDVGIIVSFGHLIPKRIIQMFPCGMLNVHPSELPKYRGAAPILHSILNGDSATALSVMRIQPKKFDVGPVLLQESIPVYEQDTALQLSKRLAARGATLLLDTLRQLPDLEPIEQHLLTETPSAAPKLTVTNAHIDWENQTQYSIDRQFKTLGEIYQLRSQWNDRPVRLVDMLPLQLSNGVCKNLPQLQPGSLIYQRQLGALAVRCKDGWVAFHRIVFKKPQSAEDFHNGYLSKLRDQCIVLTSIDNELAKVCSNVHSKVRLKNRQ